jgi:hypothetical protein
MFTFPTSNLPPFYNYYPILNFDITPDNMHFVFIYAGNVMYTTNITGNNFINPKIICVAYNNDKIQLSSDANLLIVYSNQYIKIYKN